MLERLTMSLGRWLSANPAAFIASLSLCVAVLSLTVSGITLYFSQLRESKRLNCVVSMVDFVAGTTDIKFTFAFGNSGNRDAAVQEVNLLVWSFVLPEARRENERVRELLKDDPARLHSVPEKIAAEHWSMFNSRTVTVMPAVIKPGSLALIEVSSDYDQVLKNERMNRVKELVPGKAAAIALGAEFIVVDSDGKRFVSRVPVAYHGFTGMKDGKFQVQDVWRERRTFDAFKDQNVSPDYGDVLNPPKMD